MICMPFQMKVLLLWKFVIKLSDSGPTHDFVKISRKLEEELKLECGIE